MRLTCEADIISRLLPSHNLKKASRSCRAQLTIGKKTGPNNKDGIVYLMMCTAKDRNGTKFVLLNNVEQIFGRFIAEGKATIRFRDPPQDLCLSKGDPLQLKTFLNIVKVGAMGRDLDSTTLSSLSIPSAKKVERPKTKMVVMSRRDYPMTTNFPSSLTHLQVSQCSMKRVDSRILQLRSLEVLDLSQNILQELPERWDKLKCLSRLILHTNSFSKFPLCLCKGSLQQTLTFLDLSRNTLTVIPPHLCLLENLVGLKLDNNQISCLPATIGRLSKLNVVTASGNLLDCLPAGFLSLRLESLDLFGNPFSMAEQSPSQDQIEFPTLMEIAARLIKNKKLPYDDESLHGHLCHYLDSARTCWCGSPCFQCATRYVRKVDLEKLSTEVTAVNVLGNKRAPVESFLCSQKCLLKFQSNPYAYWRK